MNIIVLLSFYPFLVVVVFKWVGDREKMQRALWIRCVVKTLQKDEEAVTARSIHCRQNCNNSAKADISARLSDVRGQRLHLSPTSCQPVSPSAWEKLDLDRRRTQQRLLHWAEAKKGHNTDDIWFLFFGFFHDSGGGETLLFTPVNYVTSLFVFACSSVKRLFYVIDIRHWIFVYRWLYRSCMCIVLFIMAVLLIYTYLIDIFCLLRHAL